MDGFVGDLHKIKTNKSESVRFARKGQDHQMSGIRSI